VFAGRPQGVLPDAAAESPSSGHFMFSW